MRQLPFALPKPATPAFSEQPTSCKQAYQNYCAFYEKCLRQCPPSKAGRSIFQSLVLLISILPSSISLARQSQHRMAIGMSGIEDPSRTLLLTSCLGTAATIAGVTAAAAYIDAKFHLRKDLRTFQESRMVRKIGERAGTRGHSAIL